MYGLVLFFQLLGVPMHCEENACTIIAKLCNEELYNIDCQLFM